MQWTTTQYTTNTNIIIIFYIVITTCTLTHGTRNPDKYTVEEATPFLRTTTTTASQEDQRQLVVPGLEFQDDCIIPLRKSDDNNDQVLTSLEYVTFVQLVSDDYIDVQAFENLPQSLVEKLEHLSCTYCTEQLPIITSDMSCCNPAYDLYVTGVYNSTLINVRKNYFFNICMGVKDAIDEYRAYSDSPSLYPMIISTPNPTTAAPTTGSSTDLSIVPPTIIGLTSPSAAPISSPSSSSSVQVTASVTDRLGTGAIAGIALGTIAMGVFSYFMLLLSHRRKQKRKMIGKDTTPRTSDEMGMNGGYNGDSNDVDDLSGDVPPTLYVPLTVDQEIEDSEEDSEENSEAEDGGEAEDRNEVEDGNESEAGDRSNDDNDDDDDDKAHDDDHDGISDNNDSDYHDDNEKTEDGKDNNISEMLRSWKSKLLSC